MLHLSYIIATVFGFGRLPYAPGTWGSLFGLTFFFVGLRYHLEAYFYLFTSFVLFIVGWLVTEHILRQSSFQDRDPSFIVIDEVVGVLVTIGILELYSVITPSLLALSFVFFRLFDILKPWPIGRIDATLAKFSKTASFGVMIDDVLAGIMAALLIRVLLFMHG